MPNATVQRRIESRMCLIRGIIVGQLESFASSDDAEYAKTVPVSFLTEGIDQTRGWAYTLLIENVILSGKAQAPFASFLFQGHVLDEKGNKMSKSVGNVIDAVKMAEEPFS